MSSKTVYSLRHMPSGALAAVRSFGNISDPHSREFHLMLMTDYDAHPMFEVDSPEEAALVLAIDTSFYNSTAKRPHWGGLDIEEFEVVKIETVTSIEAIQVQMPVRFGMPVESRKTAPMIASRYLGRSVTGDVADDLRLHFVEVPAGESVSSLIDKCVGKPIIIGLATTALTHCVGVFETPEEYTDLFKGKPSVGLVTTGLIAR